MAASSSSSSSSQELPKSWQVFISFSGKDLRNNFISHLEEAFKQAKINCYIDHNETPGEDQQVIFTRIQQSQIALPIFSSKYAESMWCLNELVEIMKQVDQEKLKIIPIFFNVTTKDVQDPYGDFGCKVYVTSKHDKSALPIWLKALESAARKIGLLLTNYSNESLLIQEIVASVKEVLAQQTTSQNVLTKEISPVSSGCNSSSKERPTFDDVMNQRLKQLEEKLDFDRKVTQIVGIVGMPGIGKTTLAEMHYNKWNDMFMVNKNISGIREKSAEGNVHWLKNTLLNGEDLTVEAEIFQMRIFLVLDDVSHKDQVKFILDCKEWFNKGSKIVITTRDKSSIAKLVDDIYVVPALNDVDAWKLFKYHAFTDEVTGTTGNFPKLTKKFVDYAGGNPRALEELGKELFGKDEAHWETRLEKLPHQCNENIKEK